MKGAIVIEGHVQGLSNTRSLGELGIPVYVLDVSHCLAQYSKYCTKYFRCPNCKQMVRVPRGRGKITITCPTCKQQFDRKS